MIEPENLNKESDATISNMYDDKTSSFRIKKCRVQELETRHLSETAVSTSKMESVVNIFLQNSSIYPLNRIGNSSTKIIKRIWVIILIFGVVGCISQVSLYLASYFNYPVVVTFESVNGEQETFPSVTICNMNSILRKYEACLKNESLDCINETLISRSVKNSTEDAVLPCLYPESISNRSSYYDWTELLDSLSYETLMKYGHQFENLVVTCFYNGQKCGPEDFKTSYSYIFGNCYTFNPEGYKKSRSSGPTTGLDLQIDLEVNKYATFTRSIGARVQVHEPSVPSDVESKGFLISPGFEHYVSITKSVISRLSEPFKDHCRKYDVGDSKQLCEIRCYDDVIQSECFCSYLFDGRSNKQQQCDMTNSKISCCVESMQTITDCICPLACHEVQYSIVLSSAVWPTRVYYENNKHNFYQRTESISSDNVLPYENVTKSHLRLKVFYDSLEYTMYKQNPAYHSSEILSQIGGQMSLWLGLSLVAVFECFESLVILCKCRKSRAP